MKNIAPALLVCLLLGAIAFADDENGLKLNKISVKTIVFGDASTMTTAATSGVTGSGTTNQFAVWTSSSAIGAPSAVASSAQLKIIGSSSTDTGIVQAASNVNANSYVENTNSAGVSGFAYFDNADNGQMTVGWGNASATSYPAGKGFVDMTNGGTFVFRGRNAGTPTDWATFNGSTGAWALQSLTVGGSPQSGTNSGDVTLAAVGSSPNSNGASLTGQQLTLQPADATNPGVVTTGTQTFAGAKTFSGAVSTAALTSTGSGHAIVNNANVNGVVVVKNTFSTGGYSYLDWANNSGTVKGSIGYGNAAVGKTGAQDKLVWESQGPDWCFMDSSAGTVCRVTVAKATGAITSSGIVSSSLTSGVGVTTGSGSKLCVDGSTGTACFEDSSGTPKVTNNTLILNTITGTDGTSKFTSGASTTTTLRGNPANSAGSIANRSTCGTSLTAGTDRYIHAFGNQTSGGYVAYVTSNGSYSPVGVTNANLGTCDKPMWQAETDSKSGFYCTGNAADTTWHPVHYTFNTNTTQVGNVGSGEDDLMTYTYPANTLAVTGRAVRFTFSGAFANNANTKTVKVYFGASMISVSLPTLTAGNYEGVATIYRTGSSTQRYAVKVTTDTTTVPVSIANGTLSQTETGSITIKLTGTATSNDDIVQNTLEVESI